MRCARCLRCPRADFPLRGKSGLPAGRWRNRGRTARIGPACRSSGLSGSLWRRWARCPCRSDFQGWEVSGTCPVWPGEYGHRLRLSGVPGRVQDGSGAVRCSWTQLDLMGHDPKPVPRWPGTLWDYGRHTDRTRYSRGEKWRNGRSAAIPMGRDRLTVKPLTLGSQGLWPSRYVAVHLLSLARNAAE
jgi:hypothetical protein